MNSTVSAPATLALLLAAGACAAPPAVSANEMQAIYEEVKTPYKYGVVIPAPPGKMVDCPSVFRFKGKWYMVYVQFDDNPRGYSTQLAESTNLLDWRPLGTV